jgi:hypothetical protein
MADTADDAVADWNSREKRVAGKMDRVRQRTLEIAHHDILTSDDDDLNRLRPAISATNLFIEQTKTFKQQRQQESEKPSLEEDNEQHLLVNNVNETISYSHQLPDLYSRIEADPYLYVATFMDTRINSALDLSPDAVNTLVFSAINLIRDEGLMARTISPALYEELGSVRAPVELFRKNSQATRLLTLCAKAYGQAIIAGAVQPAVRTIISDESLSFEVDPTLEPDSTQRQRNLRCYCDAAADLLRRVIADVPSTFTSLCRIVSRAIEVIPHLHRLPYSFPFGIAMWKCFFTRKRVQLFRWF